MFGFESDNLTVLWPNDRLTFIYGISSIRYQVLNITSLGIFCQIWIFEYGIKGIRYQVMDIKNKISIVKNPVSNIKNQVSDIRLQIPHIKYQ